MKPGTTIHKFRGKNNYAVISNVLLQNNRLSWKARGLLAYILSLPDLWDIHVEFLTDQSPQGRESVLSAIRELQQLGYMRIDVIRDEGTGRIKERRWIAFDDPSENNQIPKSLNTGLPTEVNPASGLACAGEPAAIKEIGIEKKEIQGGDAPVGDIPDELFKEAKPKKAPFTPPTAFEVEAYSKEIGYPLNGQAWCDCYEQKGWMVGKNKMKAWRAAVRNWKANGWKPNSGFNTKPTKPQAIVCL